MKLDGKLAAAIISIQGIKAVEFGLGGKASTTKGSEFHDEIIYDSKFRRKPIMQGNRSWNIQWGRYIVIRWNYEANTHFEKPFRYYKYNK